jgi:hypothetical protein
MEWRFVLTSILANLKLRFLEIGIGDIQVLNRPIGGRSTL